MALGALYVDTYQRIGQLDNWVVNWPPHHPVELGDVGRLVTDYDTGVWGFAHGATLADHRIPFEVEPYRGDAGDRFITVGDDTDIIFGFDADTPGWKWLGDASAGFLASFGSSGGLQAHVENIRRWRIKNIDALKRTLLNAASDGQLSVGHAIVVESETADVGMIIMSESSSAELKVSTNAKVAPGGMPLAKFAADFDIKSNSGGALTQPMTKRFPLAYRTLVIGTRGIWWWKTLTVHGAANLSDADRLIMMEDGLEEKDYFALYS